MVERSYKVSAWIVLAFLGVVGVSAVMLIRGEPKIDVPVAAPHRVSVPPSGTPRYPVEDGPGWASRPRSAFAERTQQAINEFMEPRQRAMSESMVSRIEAGKRSQERQRNETRGAFLKVLMISAPVVIFAIVMARATSRRAEANEPRQRQTPTSDTVPPPRPPPPSRSQVTATCEHCGTIQEPPDHGRCRHCGGRLGPRRVLRTGPWML